MQPLLELQAAGVGADTCSAEIARLNEILLSVTNQQAYLWLMSQPPDNLTACTNLPLSAAPELSLAVAAHEALQSKTKRELPAICHAARLQREKRGKQAQAAPEDANNARGKQAMA